MEHGDAGSDRNGAPEPICGDRPRAVGPVEISNQQKVVMGLLCLAGQHPGWRGEWPVLILEIEPERGLVASTVVPPSGCIQVVPPHPV